MTTTHTPSDAAIAKVAATRFLTPERPPLRPEDVAMLERATRRFHVQVEGHRVSAMVWGDAERTALLVHGWGGRGVHLAPLIRHLSAQGFQVVAFDAIAHGDSEGEWSSVRHHAASLRAVAQVLPRIDLAVAHSIGSPALFLALQAGVKVGASVHIAGPASLRRVCLQVAEAHRLPAGARDAFLARVEALAELPLAEAEDARLVAGIKHPVLLLHDPDDAEVPFGESEVIQRHLPTATLTPLPGAGHRRIVADARTLAAMDVFVRSELSGATSQRVTAVVG